MTYEKEDVNFRTYKGFNIVSETPHHFWVIRSFDNKNIPELNQSYTMVSLAVKDIDVYLASLNSEKKSKKK